MQETDGVGLVFLDTYIATLYVGSAHQQVETHQYLVGMLQHEPIVRRDVGFTLHAVEYHALCLDSRRRTELDMTGETGTTHTRNTAPLHAGHYLFCSEFGVFVQGFERRAAVYRFFPLVALYLDDDGGVAVARGVDDAVYAGHGSRYR